MKIETARTNETEKKKLNTKRVARRQVQRKNFE